MRQRFCDAELGQGFAFISTVKSRREGAHRLPPRRCPDGQALVVANVASWRLSFCSDPTHPRLPEA